MSVSGLTQNANIVEFNNCLIFSKNESLYMCELKITTPWSAASVHLLGTFRCLKIEVLVCHKTKIFVRFAVLTVGLSSLMWHHVIR